MHPMFYLGKNLQSLILLSAISNLSSPSVRPVTLCNKTLHQMPLLYTTVTEQHFSHNHKILAKQTNAIKKYENLFNQRPSKPHQQKPHKPKTAQQISKLHNCGRIVFTSHKHLTFAAAYLNM
jgi:hypothetical protein